MRKILFIILIVSLLHCVSAQQSRDSVVARLQQVIKNSEQYIHKKELKINSLKEMLEDNQLPDNEAYHIHLKLYEEYRKYKVDSAVAYLLKNKEIALRLKDSVLHNEANIQLSKLYSIKGMYVEALNLLKSIDKGLLSQKMLCEYYDSFYSFYSHYGQSTNNLYYFEQSDRYRDSLLLHLPKESVEYRIEIAVKNFFLAKFSDSEAQFLELLQKTTDKNPERALIAYFLGKIYQEKGDMAQQEAYFSMSAITDIQNTIKNNASLQSLALTHYTAGDLTQAYQFIKMAIEDAIFCNVRHRAEEGASFYTIINTAYQQKEEKQKKTLQAYLLLISILSLALIVALVYVYKQMKRLVKIRKELYHSNKELARLNAELSELNSNLQETNKIKEEYIAHFFNLCSAYIDKIESYRKFLYKKANRNQFDELVKLLKSNAVEEKEVEELYKNLTICCWTMKR
ncbi:DUF6377 domain-containing protein [Capnocytophaga sp.]|uniref:DUF6377 domain-containing protein n=1 Tax=Capnocytophaga sp. TaxID=44737 RepID=UPI0026DC1D5B|nr:DUF6377 domain-containing protein [Capnocytophaga sp.]MDO5105196.1 DUF6377 domain-containing protein [Capnocytophaga sp.]